MKRLFLLGLFLISVAILTQCTKRGNTIDTGQTAPSIERISYGDSIFYLKPSGEKYKVLPLQNKKGKYTAIPDNLQLDEKTGEIMVESEGLNNTSQTGLWYKILFESVITGAKDSAMIMISGVNYVDAFYDYKKDGNGDTIIAPIYNGRQGERIPKGIFSIKENDFSSIINPANGDINISKFFKAVRKARQTNSDSTWETLTVGYRLEDKSNKADNYIDILLYHYYTSVDSTPRNVTAAMNQHRLQTFGLNLSPLAMTKGADENLPSVLFASGRSLKPRPPCVVIVGN